MGLMQSPGENESAFVIRAGIAMMNAVARGAVYAARATAWLIVGAGRLMRVRDGTSRLSGEAQNYVRQAARVKRMRDIDF